MKQTDVLRLTRDLRCDEGTQLVEFALVLPLLLLLALGIIDMGGLIHAHQVVSNAAREGARLSAAPENHDPSGSTFGQIRTYVQDYITTENGIHCTSTPTVTIDQNGFIATPSGIAMSASTVTVVCPYSMQYLPSLIGSVIPATVNIKGEVKFRNFY
jgi:Flp pilus assembly protein TadG